MTDGDRDGEPDASVDELVEDAREWWAGTADQRVAARDWLQTRAARQWQIGNDIADAVWHVGVWLRMHLWVWLVVGRRRSVSDGRLAAPALAARAWWDGWGERPDEIGSLVVTGSLVGVGVLLGIWASIQAAAVAGVGALIGLLWWSIGIGAATVAIAPWFIFPALGPLRPVVARLWLLLLQLAHGGTAVVERESGKLELQPLWEHDDRQWATETSDGDELVVDDANVTRWWFQPFAFVIELGGNLDELQEDSRPPVTDGGEDNSVLVGDGAGRLVPTGVQRAGSRELKPVDIADDEQLLSLIPLRPRLRNAASGAFARDGRDEGLRAEGGQQQLSPLITMLFALTALVLGFGMVHFTL